MEIMRGLGNEYLEIDQHENALGIFQEGIIKSMCIRSADPEDFGGLIMGVQKCYERMGWYKEVPIHLMDAWSFWNKDEIPLVTYTYFPLWSLHQFYHRYEMYDKAIKASDEIIKFIIERGGSNHPELARELYFRGNTLANMGRPVEAIESYRKGLYILECNKLEYNEDYRYYNPILSNLLFELIKVESWDDTDIVLDKIKKYGETTGNEDEYNTVLTAAAYVLCNDAHYERALKINTELLGRTLSDKRKQTAERQQEEILYSKEVTDAIPELENILKDTSFASNVWFDTAFKLTSAYFRKKDSEKAMMLLNNMYQAIPQNSTAKDEYYISIIGTLFNVYLEQGDYDLALKYALEKKEYFSTIPHVPDLLRFHCMNNIVVAKLKSNKLDGIYEDWDMAELLCRNLFGEESEEYGIQLHNKGRALHLEHKYDEAKRYYLDAIALQIKVKGHPIPNTVKYLSETNEQITDAELDL